MKIFAFCVFFISVTSFGEVLNPRYFANQKVQRLAPEAFALQPETADFHKNLKVSQQAEMDELLNLIAGHPDLLKKIEMFKELEWAHKEEVLREVFALEVEALKIDAPDLIISNSATKNQAYFDFDIEKPTPGRVLLNPEELQKDPNPYSSLMLLIHETRHSAQFQRAFLSNDKKDIIGKFYRAAFTAQKKHADKIRSFCDFLTLNNEYEAFQFGNYVVTVLTNGNVDTLGMGTYASQYNRDLSLKIDLTQLFDQHPEAVVEKFNLLEKAQYDLLIKQ